MELLVMRHGSAEESRDDFNRQLTKQGKIDVLDATKAISASGFIPEVIYASPLTRARQTAGIVAEQLRLDVIECDSIVPSADSKTVSGILDKLDTDRVLIVSHQPFVSMFIDYLTGEQIYMTTAGLGMIHLDLIGPGCGDLHWTRT